MPEKVVYVVHCVDTEGPMHESLTATFERLKDIFGIDLTPSKETLRDIQLKKLDFGGIEDDVAKVFSPALLSYMDTWDKIDNMLFSIMSEKFRKSKTDSFGNGWVYNWHCLDHVGFDLNPRRRDMGYHNIFDHYKEMCILTGSNMDGIHFHHHPIPFSREAHRPTTNYLSNDPIIFKILARKIIDRNWFPAVYRPGFHTTRPDSHWFLEQYIPFEYANQAVKEEETLQKDLSDGRFGDWRNAPLSWVPYHPHHDNYQIKGNCRRWIARCLNIGTRLRLLSEADVEQAFAEADAGKSTILAFTNHDFRNMVDDINGVRDMIEKVALRYKEVKYKYSEARQAMREALAIETQPSIQLNVRLQDNRLSVISNKPTFGPQPFLALKTKSGNYYHDNFDFQQVFYHWTYTFDSSTFPIDALDSIGVATCDSSGGVAVAVLKINEGEQVITNY